MAENGFHGREGEFVVKQDLVQVAAADAEASRDHPRLSEFEQALMFETSEASKRMEQGVIVSLKAADDFIRNQWKDDVWKLDSQFSSLSRRLKIWRIKTECEMGDMLLASKSRINRIVALQNKELDKILPKKSKMRRRTKPNADLRL